MCIRDRVNEDEEINKKRVSKRKSFFDEDTSNDTVLEGSHKFIVETYNSICYQLVVQLQRRSEALKSIFDLFKCILPDSDEYSDTDPASTDIEKLIEMAHLF